jgi:hypothetical protein
LLACSFWRRASWLPPIYHVQSCKSPWTDCAETYWTSYAENFGKDGFNYLRNNSVFYRNAHYLHANTETIVGHATMNT